MVTFEEKMEYLFSDFEDGAVLKLTDALLSNTTITSLKLGRRIKQYRFHEYQLNCTKYYRPDDFV